MVDYYQISKCRSGLLLIRYNDSNRCLVRTTTGETYSVGDNHWYCYILKSTTSNRTYVGYTKNVFRRLRQHNGEIKGGAKTTSRGRPWKLVVYIKGFLTENEAMSFEWFMHHPKWINRSKLNLNRRPYSRGNSLKCRLDHLELMLTYGIWRKKYPIKNTIMSLFWHIDNYSFINNSLVIQYHLK